MLDDRSIGAMANTCTEDLTASSVKEQPVDILHPLCELASTPEWHNCGDDPSLDDTAQPVFIDGNVYTRGFRNTLRKYSTRTRIWSRLSPPLEIEIEDYLITCYQGQLIWIGGTTPKSRNEYEPNRNIFVLNDSEWREDRDFVLPLPAYVSSTHRILASSDDKYLTVIMNDGSDLLIFDGREWIKRNRPSQYCSNILVHRGTVYVVVQSNGHFCCIISLKSLLEEEYNWKRLPSPYRHSNLTVAGGHVVTVTTDSPRMFCVLGLSPKSDSWIELYAIKCETHRSISPTIPSIIGINNGKLLLMGRMKVKDSTQDMSPQFDVRELTFKLMPYNPKKDISLSAVLKLELYAEIPVLTQLYTKQKLGPLKERAGFFETSERLPFDRLYGNIHPPAKCIQSWVDNTNSMRKLQPTWVNFFDILRDREVNLKEIAEQIHHYLQNTASRGELSVLDTDSEDSSESMACKRSRSETEETLNAAAPQTKKSRASNSESVLASTSIVYHNIITPQLKQERSRREDTPKLHELDLLKANNVEVRMINSVSSEWVDLATHLHFDGPDIERIRRDCHHQTRDCCRTVLDEWLRGKGRKPKTWNTIFIALDEAQFSEVARKLHVALGLSDSNDHNDSSEAPQQRNASWFTYIKCTLL